MNQTYTLITGGTTGIGYATAQLLIAEGRNVIITGRDKQRLQQATSALDCQGFVLDNTKISSINDLASTLIKQDIAIEGLVLNAGMFIPEPIEATTEAIFDETIATNTKGPLFTLKALLPVLQNPSSVVYISSIVIDKGFEACASYAASKAASEAFIRVANIELASKGVRINTVRPGVTETPIHAKTGMPEEASKAFFETLTKTPIGRVLQPSDLSGAIAFLLSDASIALRNAVLDVDGGLSL